MTDDTRTPLTAAEEPRYVVDRAALVDAFEAHAWSSPEQMADMLLDGFEQIGLATLDAARTPSQPDARSFTRWFLSQPYANRLAFLRENMPARTMPYWARQTPSEPDLREAGWAFLNTITRQDYVGQMVDVDPDDVDAFRAALASQPAPADQERTPRGFGVGYFEMSPAPADPDRTPSQPDLREALAEKLVDAILTWKSGHVVEGLAQQYRAASQPAPAAGGVHNHGPEDGPGVRCREHLIGACRLATLDAARTPSQSDLRDALKAELRQAIASALADGFNLTGPADAVVDRIWPYFDIAALASQPAPADLAAARLRDLQTYISGEADNGRVERRIANAVINKAESAARLLHAARTPEPAGVRTLPCGACYHGPHENTKCSDCECDFTPAGVRDPLREAAEAVSRAFGPETAADFGKPPGTANRHLWPYQVEALTALREACWPGSTPAGVRDPSQPAPADPIRVTTEADR